MRVVKKKKTKFCIFNRKQNDFHLPEITRIINDISLTTFDKMHAKLLLTEFDVVLD